MNLEFEFQILKDVRCLNSIIIHVKRNLNIIFADGFAIILSLVVLPVLF